MTILKILKWPEPVLMKPSAPVEKINSKIEKLAENMIETMYAAPGVGLAANQVGELIRIAVIDVGAPEDKKDPSVLINPKIIELEDEELLNEGCLSIPGFKTLVPRATRVTAEWTDLSGKTVRVEVEGLFAHAIQHETDHLNGKLFPDKLSRLKKNLMYRKVRKAIEDGTFGK